uniref:Uncharacterized protein n=1 Tax=Glycine max TaxID=3847 RepID=C6TI85_SOYBN|nr:unknown [Glycine max]
MELLKNIIRPPDTITSCVPCIIKCTEQLSFCSQGIFLVLHREPIYKGLRILVKRLAETKWREESSKVVPISAITPESFSHIFSLSEVNKPLCGDGEGQACKFYALTLMPQQLFQAHRLLDPIVVGGYESCTLNTLPFLSNGLPNHEGQSESETKTSFFKAPFT